MSETIRSFIAIELNQEIQQELGNLQAQLRKSDADIKWVKPENIHLTLRFLGNIDSSQIVDIKKVLNNLSTQTQSFQMNLSKIGAFPNLNYPKVIWVGVEEGKNQLIEINENLESRLEKNGFSRENRSFHPHITLGRVKSQKNRDRLKFQIQSINFLSKNKMIAQKITFFKSILAPEGSIYASLHEATFTRT